MSYRVLVAEDDPSHAQLVVKILSGMKITDVTLCKDGKEALAVLEDRKSPFDLIISDMHMPNMSGMELLDAVKENRHHFKTPFMMLTADESTDLIIDSKKLGIAAYLTKPCTVDRFSEKVRLALLSRK